MDVEGLLQYNNFVLECSFSLRKSYPRILRFTSFTWHIYGNTSRWFAFTKQVQCSMASSKQVTWLFSYESETVCLLKKQTTLFYKRNATFLKLRFFWRRVHMQISHDPRLHDPDPGSKEKSMEKSCVSFGKDCRLKVRIPPGTNGTSLMFLFQTL